MKTKLTKEELAKEYCSCALAQNDYIAGYTSKERMVLEVVEDRIKEIQNSPTIPRFAKDNAIEEYNRFKQLITEDGK